MNYNRKQLFLQFKITCYLSILTTKYDSLSMNRTIHEIQSTYAIYLGLTDKIRTYLLFTNNDKKKPTQ